MLLCPRGFAENTSKKGKGHRLIAPMSVEKSCASRGKSRLGKITGPRKITGRTRDQSSSDEGRKKFNTREVDLNRND